MTPPSAILLAKLLVPFFGLLVLSGCGKPEELVWQLAPAAVEKGPLRAEVKGMCEILGLDPLYLANEGRLVLFVPEDEAETVLAAMHAVPEGEGATIVGRAVPRGHIPVTMRTAFGGARIVDMLVGEQLPRIC